MSEIEERARNAAADPDNAAKRAQHERTGVDEDQAAPNERADPRDTDHPTGHAQARENRENEPPS